MLAQDNLREDTFYVTGFSQGGFSEFAISSTRRPRLTFRKKQTNSSRISTSFILHNFLAACRYSLPSCPRPMSVSVSASSLRCCELETLLTLSSLSGDSWDPALRIHIQSYRAPCSAPPSNPRMDRCQISTTPHQHHNSTHSIQPCFRTLRVLGHRPACVYARQPGSKPREPPEHRHVVHSRAQIRVLRLVPEPGRLAPHILRTERHYRSRCHSPRGGARECTGDAEEHTGDGAET